MLTKTITFKDYSDPPKDVTREFYFNLETTDMAELEFSKKEGFIEYFKRLVAEESAGGLIAAMKEILEKSVGRKHADGIRFERTPDITAEFMESRAYPKLFMELIDNDGENIIPFIMGVVPPEFAKEITPEILAAATAEIKGEKPAEPEVPAWIKEDRDPTQEEFKHMTPEQMQQAFVAKGKRQAAADQSREVETLPQV